ncbi:unnamed protein product [Tetraodon nigroviridis]|uniref:(spotted green pufferfish) hypothetical protein n=1 Tax=Tetraodon nigroviridis TaxID=99883 RepID=Q4SJI3_TETNG|nr:unnamed protein product [Tetraodon nigroviridis]
MGGLQTQASTSRVPGSSAKEMLSTSTETCFTVTSNPNLRSADLQAAGTSLGMGALKWERGPIPSPTLQSFSTTSGRETRWFVRADKARRPGCLRSSCSLWELQVRTKASDESIQPPPRLPG